MFRKFTVTTKTIILSIYEKHILSYFAAAGIVACVM